MARSDRESNSSDGSLNSTDSNPVLKIPRIRQKLWLVEAIEIICLALCIALIFVTEPLFVLTPVAVLIGLSVFTFMFFLIYGVSSLLLKNEAAFKKNFKLYLICSILEAIKITFASLIFADLMGFKIPDIKLTGIIIIMLCTVIIGCIAIPVKVNNPSLKSLTILGNQENTEHGRASSLELAKTFMPENKEGNCHTSNNKRTATDQIIDKSYLQPKETAP